MKTFLAVLFTGALLSSVAFSANGDPLREERFKAKYGRYTAAEDARREALVQPARTHAMECTKHECCSHKGIASLEASKAASHENAAFAEVWAQAKFGRSIRRADNRSDVPVAGAGHAPAGACDDVKCCD